MILVGCESNEMMSHKNLDAMNIQILATYGCAGYLKIEWSGVLLTDDMGHIIPLPLRGYISVWTDNDLKFIDQYVSTKITLSRLLDKAMDLKHKIQMKPLD